MKYSSAVDPFESLRIRAGDRGDTRRIEKDWLLSYAKSNFARFLTPNPQWGLKASQVYWDWQRTIVRALLERCETWVATWAEAPSTIAGWCVMERAAGERPPVVHYVNVLPSYRHHGVAKRLLAPALDAPRVIYTHRMPLCQHLPIPPGWSFDPRLAIEPQERRS